MQSPELCIQAASAEELFLEFRFAQLRQYRRGVVSGGAVRFGGNCGQFFHEVQATCSCVVGQRVALGGSGKTVPQVG